MDTLALFQNGIRDLHLHFLELSSLSGPTHDDLLSMRRTDSAAMSFFILPRHNQIIEILVALLLT